MPSQFFGLSISYSGLLASNAALNTTADKGVQQAAGIPAGGERTAGFSDLRLRRSGCGNPGNRKSAG